MRKLSWHVFSKTGNVETYLLFKELDRETQVASANEEEEELVSDSETLTH